MSMGTSKRLELYPARSASPMKSQIFWANC